MKKNYWPYYIVVAFIPFVAGIIATLVIALDNPVAMDDTFLENYQKVDKNYNELMAKQVEFNKEINATVITPSLVMGEQELSIVVTQKLTGAKVNTATFKGVLTRPETQAMDQNLTFVYTDSGVYKAKVNVPKVGRWQVKTLVSVGQNSGMVQREYSIR